MPDWTGEVDGCDYAFSGVGATFYKLKDQMFKDIEGVREDKFNEQTILVHFSMIRLLAKRFRKSYSVHFSRKDIEKAKDEFWDWFDRSKIPTKYKDELKKSAKQDFERIQKEIYPEK